MRFDQRLYDIAESIIDEFKSHIFISFNEFETSVRSYITNLNLGSIRMVDVLLVCDSNMVLFTWYNEMTNEMRTLEIDIKHFLLM